MLGFFNGNKKITEKLYEQNLELAVKNKTLSLLENLYQTSVLTLMPKEMAEAITGIIRKDLNLEFAGILVFDKKIDTLTPLAFSKSERLVMTLQKLGFLLKDITIPNVLKNDFFKRAVYYQENNMTNRIEEVWQELIAQEHLQEIKKESHIKTVLIYPLIKGKEVSGVLLLGLNRDYETLNNFEKESIKSFINVISLLLDKAYLYKNLQDSYEITKRAYAVEKKAKEELEELDKVKNQFLSQAQHDLRTPLTAIMGYSDLMMNGTFGKQSKKTIEVIKKIQEVTQNMKKRAESFLDTAQFKLGKGFLSLKPGVEIVPILDEIVAELKFKSDEKGTQLKLEKIENQFTMNADREKLKAALFNVIDNAIKYAPKGKVTISINKGNKDKIIIGVKDTGIGIPPEKIKTLFETQFDRSEQAKKTAEGKGVGLYLASQIIKYHEGKIWAESEGEGKGSTFYVELPIDKAF